MQIEISGPDHQAAVALHDWGAFAILDVSKTPNAKRDRDTAYPRSPGRRCLPYMSGYSLVMMTRNNHLCAGAETQTCRRSFDEVVLASEELQAQEGLVDTPRSHQPSQTSYTLENCGAARLAFEVVRENSIQSSAAWARLAERFCTLTQARWRALAQSGLCSKATVETT